MDIVDYKKVRNTDFREVQKYHLILNHKIANLIEDLSDPTDKQMAELYLLECNRFLIWGKWAEGVESMFNALLHFNINIIEKHCGVDYHGRF